MSARDPQEGNLPLVPIGQNELEVIDAVLMVYIVYLQKRPSIPPKAQIPRAEHLRKRLQPILAPNSFQPGEDFFLSQEEFTLIIHGMTIYINHLSQIVPPSEQRDSVLREMHGLQAKLAAGMES